MNGSGGAHPKQVPPNWSSSYSPAYPTQFPKKMSADRSGYRDTMNKPPVPKSGSFQRSGSGRNSNSVSRPNSWPASTPGFCRSTTEIACATDVEFDTVIFNWKISNFMPLRLMATDKGLPPEGDVLTSPVFLDNESSAWWLRLYPYEDREQHRGKVSLFLHTDRAKKGDIYFSFRFAALDSSSREVEDTGGGSALHKFAQGESVRNYGFYDFIRDEETLSNALFDDTLWVYCEVNIFTNPQTVVQDGSVVGHHGEVITSAAPNACPNPFGRQASYSSGSVIRQPSVHGGPLNL